MLYLLLVSLIATSSSEYIVESSRGSYIPEPDINATIIGIENGYTFDTRIGEPTLPSNLRIDSYPEGSYGYYLVQFTGPIYTAWRKELQEIGVKIYAYWPYYAYLVGMTTDKIETVKSRSFVRWIGIFQPAYKINIELLNQKGIRKINAQLYPDADLIAVLKVLKEKGIKVLGYQKSEIGQIVYLESELSEIHKIASIPEVLSISPNYPDIPFNENSQWVCQKGWASADTSRPIWRRRIRGENTILGFSDTGITTAHLAFRDPAIAISDSGHFPNHRKIIAYLLLTNAVFGDVGGTYHGTHVGGTIAGDDSITGGTNLNDGVALKARMFFVDIANAAGSLVTPTDLTPLYNMFYLDPISGPIRQHSASWGRSGTGYIDRDAFSDAYHWLRKDFLDIFAAGNSGPTYRTIMHAAYAKNVLAVGAVQNGTSSNQIASFSSRGPCLDLRIKPTVVTPGNNIMSADGAGTTGYKTLSGTSMATPACNAAIGLMRQYLQEGWYPTGTKNPADSISYVTAALLRAMTIVAADPNVGTFVVPDSNIGFGRVDVESVLFFAGDARKLALRDELTGLTTGQFRDFLIQVTDTTLALRAALVWTDTAAAVGSNPNLVNDLNLQMTNPYGTYYRGNQMSGGQSVVNPASFDNRNVEEVCRINIPRSGVWTCRVSAQNIPNPPQPFALVISGGMNLIVGINENFTPEPINTTSFIGISPNPSSNQINLTYQLATHTKIRLKVFDITGRVLTTIIDGKQPAGHYQISWLIDKNIANGIYFIRLETDNTTQTRPLIIIR